MILGKLPLFTGAKELAKVPIYLAKDLGEFFVMLSAVLKNLRFSDNFQSFKTEVTIAAGAEATIPNQLKNNRIPTEWWVVDRTNVDATISRGPTAWTHDLLYIKNHGASEITVTIRFFE